MNDLIDALKILKKYIDDPDKDPILLLDDTYAIKVDHTVKGKHLTILDDLGFDQIIENQFEKVKYS